MVLDGKSLRSQVSLRSLQQRLRRSPEKQGFVPQEEGEN